MYLYQIACCTILLAIAVSAYPGGHAESYANLNQYHHGGGHHDHHGHHEEEHHDYHAPAHYKYEYAVKDPHTGDHKQAWESRDGDKVKGSYSLYEPDGTKRIVDYTSDKHSGFNAHVQKIGHSTHDYIPHHHQHQHHDEHHGFGF